MAIKKYQAEEAEEQAEEAEEEAEQLVEIEEQPAAPDGEQLKQLYEMFVKDIVNVPPEVNLFLASDHDVAMILEELQSRCKRMHQRVVTLRGLSCPASAAKILVGALENAPELETWGTLEKKDTAL